jgi:DNA-binding CsgD family transcriptional regulator
MLRGGRRHQASAVSFACAGTVLSKARPTHASRARSAAIADPQAVLTHRELECIRWVTAGKTDSEIASLLGVSQMTVRSHIDQARRKLRARTRAQAVARLVLSGLS